MQKGEIIIYQPEDKSVSLEVCIEDETVWLTQAQIAELLQTTPQNITLHIKNIYKEEELDMISTCKDFLQVQIENKREVKRKTKHYNKSHDRFLIIDKTKVYHIGASLKDLGKKWFAFAKIDLDVREMIKRLHL